MATTLKLDAGAVALLFPEGSEQRLKITAGVAAEVTKKLFKTGIESAIQTELLIIERANKPIVEAELKKYFEENTGYNTNYALTPKHKMLITDRVEEAIALEVNATIHSAIDEKLPVLLEKAFSEDGALGSICKRAVSIAVHAKVKEAVEARVSGLTISI